MALGYCDTDKITAIADSIRTKKGTTDTILLEDMPSEIESISSEGGKDYTVYVPVANPDTSLSLIYPYSYAYSSSYPTVFENISSLELQKYSSAAGRREVTIGAFIKEFTSDTATGPEGLKFKNCTIVVEGSSTFYGPFSAWSSAGTEAYLTLTHLEFTNCILKGKGVNCFFSNQSSLTSLDLSSVTLEEVTDMEGMFSGCSSLTTLDLSNFNTQNVTSMYRVFSGCSSLTSLDLSSFNTSSVTDMSGMFDSCSKLTSLDLSNFNTSSVTNMKWMFSNCSSLTSLDLSSFNTSSVTDMGSAYVSYGMFYNCTSLTTLTLGENWASNSSITSLNLSSCPLTHDSCLDVFNKLATKTSTSTLTLKSATKALMSDEEIAIATNKGWTVS